jgi:hypothetical protein
MLAFLRGPAPAVVAAAPARAKHERPAGVPSIMAFFGRATATSSSSGSSAVVDTAAAAAVAVSFECDASDDADDAQAADEMQFSDADLGSHAGDSDEHSGDAQPPPLARVVSEGVREALDTAFASEAADVSDSEAWLLAGMCDDDAPTQTPAAVLVLDSSDGESSGSQPVQPSPAQPACVQIDSDFDERAHVVPPRRPRLSPAAPAAARRQRKRQHEPSAALVARTGSRTAAMSPAARDSIRRKLDSFVVRSSQADSEAPTVAVGCTDIATLEGSAEFVREQMAILQAIQERQ